MEKDYLEILSLMGFGSKEKSNWMDWKVRIENLIEAAIEIAQSKEDWPIKAVLSAALETIDSEKGELLERLLEKLDWDSRKEEN